MDLSNADDDFEYVRSNSENLEAGLKASKEAFKNEMQWRFDMDQEEFEEAKDAHKLTPSQIIRKDRH